VVELSAIITIIVSSQLPHLPLSGRIMSKLLLLLLLITATTLAQAATIYKWTDAEGQVHYTRTPPPKSMTGEKIEGQDADKIPAVRVDETQAVSEPAQQPPATVEITAAEKKRAELCQTAQHDLNEMRRTDRVKEHGHEIEITEEERLRRIDELNEMVQEHCTIRAPQAVQPPAQQTQPQPVPQPEQPPVQRTEPLPVQPPVQRTEPLPVQTPVQQTAPQPVQTPVQRTAPLQVQTPVQQTAPQPVQTPVQQTAPQPVQTPVQRTAPLPVQPQVKRTEPLPVQPQVQRTEPLPVQPIEPQLVQPPTSQKLLEMVKPPQPVMGK
jgi:hypothetical protein